MGVAISRRSRHSPMQLMLDITTIYMGCECVRVHACNECDRHNADDVAMALGTSL